MYEKYAKLSFQIQSVVISIFIKPKWPDQVVLFPNFIYGMAEFVHIKSGHFVMNNQVFIYVFIFENKPIIGNMINLNLLPRGGGIRFTM